MRWYSAASCFAFGSYLKKSWLRRCAASTGPIVPMSGTWHEMHRSTRYVSPSIVAWGKLGNSCWTWTLKSEFG